MTATAMATPAPVVLLPDAGPLITLAYADALDLLFKPGWSLTLVDMVLHEMPYDWNYHAGYPNCRA